MNKRLALLAPITAAPVPIAAAHATTARPAAAPARPAAPPTAAHAATPDADIASGLPRIARTDLRTPAATRAMSHDWPARVLHARQSAGGAVVVIGFGPSGDDAVPIDDVNHDGAQEVLQARLSGSQPSVVVLTGTTGRALWTVPGAAVIGAEYAAVPGGAGVVLVYSFGDGQGTPG